MCLVDCAETLNSTPTCSQETKQKRAVSSFPNIFQAAGVKKAGSRDSKTDDRQISLLDNASDHNRFVFSERDHSTRLKIETFWHWSKRRCYKLPGLTLDWPFQDACVPGAQHIQP
jgi:hypothetical protein